MTAPLNVAAVNFLRRNRDMDPVIRSSSSLPTPFNPASAEVQRAAPAAGAPPAEPLAESRGIDRFEPLAGTEPMSGAGEAMAGAGPELSDKGRQALARFNQRMESALTVRVQDMFNPALETVPGTALLSNVPPEKVMSLVSDLLLDIPLGDSEIGRAVADAVVKSPLGFAVDGDILTKSPKELGGDIGDAVKDGLRAFINDARHDHAGLFYSAAALAAVGAGTLTYAQGTEVLEKLGIDPKFRLSFFKGGLTVSGNLSIGPRFSHIGVNNLNIGSRGSFGNVSYSSNVAFDERGRLDNANANLRLNVPLDGPGDRLSMGVGYRHDFQTESDRISADITGEVNKLRFGVNAAIDPKDGDFRAEGTIGKDLGNGRIEGFTSIERNDGRTDTQAGVRLTLRF